MELVTAPGRTPGAAAEPLTHEKSPGLANIEAGAFLSAGVHPPGKTIGFILCA
jgi:hypothetical protein